MRVFVLKVYDEGCGVEDVHVCIDREEVESIVAKAVNDMYVGDKGTKEKLAKCLADLGLGCQGVVWSLYFDVYETELVMPKMCLLRWMPDRDMFMQHELYTSREKAASAAALHYNRRNDRIPAGVASLKDRLMASRDFAIEPDDDFFQILELGVNE